MSTQILLKYSATPGAVPPAANILPRELAVNSNDGRLFLLRNSDSTVIEFSNTFHRHDALYVPLSNAGLPVAGGVATKVSYNQYGLITSGTTLTVSDLPSIPWSLLNSTPTTLSGYGITDAQPASVSLSKISALSGTAGILVRNGTNWELDTTVNQELLWTIVNASFTATATQAYAINSTNASITVTLPANPNPSDSLKILDYSQNCSTYNIIVKGNGNNIAGYVSDLLIDVSSVSTELTFIPGTGWIITDTGNVVNGTGDFATINSPVFTGAPSAPTPATSNNSTVLATTAYVQNQGYLTTNQTITVSGDATSSGTTSLVLTLASTGVTPGIFGSATSSPILTVNGKGLIIGASSTPISVTLSGDATGTGPISSSIPITLASSGVVSGTYKSVTVNAKGIVTGGSNPTTIVGYGITDPIAYTSSPALTGSPTAPTPAVNTNNTLIATTAFVLGQANSTASTIAVDGIQSAGFSNLYARADHVHPTDTSRAPIASPALTGIPTAPTATAGTNNTQIATTAFVTNALVAYTPLTGTGTSGTWPINITGSAASATNATNATNATTVGGYTATQLLAGSGGSGLGASTQSWQSPARGLNVIYTNTTSNPIAAIISVKYFDGSLNAYPYTILVNGVGVKNSLGAGNVDTVTIIVPPGQTYEVAGGYTLNYWTELR